MNTRKLLGTVGQAIFYVAYHIVWYIGIILFALMYLPCKMFDDNWK